MRLKLTLVRPTATSDDIVVTTDAAATIGDIAATIMRVDPQAAPTVARGGQYTMSAKLPGAPEALLLPPDAPVGEAWIGSGASVSIVDAGVFYVPEASGKGPVVATVRVTAGADEGRTFDLRAGSWSLGRDSACDIVLTDPLVSKKHLRFEVDTAVEIVDLGSANGVVVDGGIVGRLRVTKKETILVGDTEMVIEVNPVIAETGVTPKAGPIFFNRSPQVEPRYVGAELVGPEVPQELDLQDFPLLSMIAPLIMGGALFAFTHNPQSLLFVALSPVLMIGNYVSQRMSRKKKQKSSIVKFDARLSALTEQLAQERVHEHEMRLREAPSTAEILAQSARFDSLLWTRRPEHWSFLNVRLGTGTMESRNTIREDQKSTSLPEFQSRFDELVAANRFVHDVPIIDNLYDSGALGISGAPDAVVEVTNALLVQLTGLHSPAELVVASIITPAWSSGFEWLKWIPHTSSPHSPITGSHLADSAASGAALVSAIEDMISARQEANRATAQRRGAISEDQTALERGATVGEDAASAGTPSLVPAMILLISDDASVDRARLVQLSESAADAGIYPVWIARSPRALPAVCRTFLNLAEDGGPATAAFVRLGETIDDVVTEHVSPADALDFARRLAPVIDAGALVADSSDLPRSVSMVSLLGHDLFESSEAVTDRWRQNESIHNRTGGENTKLRTAGKLRAIVGSSGVDGIHLDLRTQGPHALVGGTTGSGKSEFLQAWVLGMAAEYSPDRVTFLFVDYKGGSAFADCVSLPHCVGLVTDLSPHLVRRALTSLRAELRFREHLLNRKKAKDLLELEKRGDPECPPALVLVIDEFAALVGEVPEFVDGVVDIAQRGRSLGIHLIMATQRPAGVIKDNLRANTNLRIALRMADESDSQDVVGVKEAGGFDPSIPGRGLAKTGPGRLTQFQSGYAGGWTSREPERPGIEIAQLRFGSENRWEEPRRSDVEEVTDLGPTDQQRLVSTVVSASHAANIPAPRRPWLDELATVYELGRLHQRTDAELLLGVSDVPEEQQQRPVFFRPDTDGHISIFGTGGSGKSATLRTLAAAAAITPRGGAVEVYGLDFGAGSLRMLEALPHVGSIINGDDSERVIRLFRMIKQELESRAPRFAAANASSIADYRTLANRPDEKRILLLIDGYPTFRQEFEIPAGRSAWYSVFQEVISDGRQLGIHIAFTADRPGSVPSSISSSVQRRVVLRLAEEGGYSMLDVPSDILGVGSAPGRAIVDNLETQIAILGGSTSMSDQSAATRALGEAMTRAGVAPAAAIGSLPKEYPPAQLPDRVGDRPVLGISDENLGPVGFEASGTFLIAGPPASGRTNALEAVALAVSRFDPDARRYYFGNKRSRLGSDVEWTASAVTIDDAAALAKEIVEAVADADTEGRIAVFVESISEFLQTSADQPILDLIKAIKRSDHFLVAESETSTWSSSWPLLGEIKNGRRGILLQPEAIDGELILKTPLPRMARSEMPEGRGILITSGKFSRVQLPLVGAE
ncbi:FtsK/SpoIIIE domain-containing protein [Parafrigoribacterium soli]|uniref:FtsK/SpoIIIE domain-containing protein n=1 Tax=Parafrigoribacterium soli TaxID=3144663 RepID=UPI0032EBA202